jgi:subtilisin family serine protease
MSASSGSGIQTGPDPYRQWALYRCGFPAVWPTLDTGPDPGEIAVIDRGEKGLNHRELAGRVTRKPERSRTSRAAHAAAVAAIIAARRDDHEGDADGRMDGCCSARVRVYSAWDADEQFDLAAVRAALFEVARMKLPVVNLSLSISLPNQRDIDDAIAACVRNGVVVVAAMGNGNDPDDGPIYPAANPDVIAVGATNMEDRPASGSNRGEHIWVSAPGESILTVIGDDPLDYKYLSGSSFAAAMVTAAVWLARRRRPDLTPGDVRELLRRSAYRPDGTPGHDSEIGHGRLDMRRLGELLR